MKFSEQWLRELIDLPVNTDELLDQLTMAGLEVDSSEPVVNFSDVVVGEVIDLQPHPDADKLQIAKVNVNSDEPLQIVCGAENIKIGLKTAVALVGATLPNDFKIKTSKLRGVESFGMLCGADELGLDDDTNGIIELPNELTIGQDLDQALNLKYNIIEIDLTPNRGDCLSIKGVLREVGVINRVDLTPAKIADISITSDKKISVSVKTPKACPLYLGRVIDNINPKSKTPSWMVEKLRRGGIRSLGPLIDVTNFVMLELGQPMHAFDLSEISGGITVRNAFEGEILTLLDDKEIKLKPETLLIADDKKPLALAGIMGGLNSGVSDDTNALFLECAFFDPIELAGTARAYAMHTESSHRFERGVDFALQFEAINRASALLLEIVGGDCGEIIEVNHLSNTDKVIILNKTNVQRLLGVDFEDDVIVDILQRLGMTVTQIAPQQWQVNPPSFRFDIDIEADLIEELGRIYGYNNIESTYVSVPMHLPKNDESKRDLTTIKHFFTARDYQEIISYTFVNPKTQEILGVENGAETLVNPISNDLSQMRTSLWSSMLPKVSYNLSRQHKRIRFFETGLRFFNDSDGQLQQTPTLAGIVCGERFSINWNEKSSPVDFFDLKYDLENLIKIPIKFIKGKHSALHPKQTAKIIQDDRTVGFIGKIHPEVATKLDIVENCFLFEMDLNVAESVQVSEFKMFSKFPEISRDLAIVIDADILSNKVIEKIKKIDDKFLKDARIFDVYRGKNFAKNQQSLAINITLQATDKTLTDIEIEHSMMQITEVLVQNFDAKLRE